MMPKYVRFFVAMGAGVLSGVLNDSFTGGQFNFKFLSALLAPQFPNSFIHAGPTLWLGFGLPVLRPRWYKLKLLLV